MILELDKLKRSLTMLGKSLNKLRARSEINSQNWRSGLG